MNANRDAAIRFGPVENSQAGGSGEQFQIGAVLQHSNTPSLLFEGEDEDDFEARNAWEACLVAPSRIENARLIIEDAAGSSKEVATLTLDPGHWWRTEFTLPPKIEVRLIKLVDQNGRVLLSFKPEPKRHSDSLPEPAKEPKQPTELSSGDQLFLVGEHLEQYRHPTRDPEQYWQEAIERDPGGLSEPDGAGPDLMYVLDLKFQGGGSDHLCPKRIERLSELHPNPITGEAALLFGIGSSFPGRG